MSNTTCLYLLTALLGVSLGLESVYDAATALGVLQLACALAMCYFGYCNWRERQARLAQRRRELGLEVKKKGAGKHS